MRFSCCTVLRALDDMWQMGVKRLKDVGNEQQRSYIMKWAEALILPTDVVTCWEQREAGQRAAEVVKQQREEKKKPITNHQTYKSLLTEAKLNNQVQQLFIS